MHKLNLNFLILFVIVGGFNICCNTSHAYTFETVDATSQLDEIDYGEIPPVEMPTPNELSSQKLTQEILQALRENVKIEGGPDQKSSKPDDVAPFESGSFRIPLPFSTSRADLSRPAGVDPSGYQPFPTNKLYPYSATGKLARLRPDNDGKWRPDRFCTASLVRVGVIITAAHCITDVGKPLTGPVTFQFIPGFRETQDGYDTTLGIWESAKFSMPDEWVLRNVCLPHGFCTHDVALIRLKSKKLRGKEYYAGDIAGKYFLFEREWGFDKSRVTHVTQLGYPHCLDGGRLMQQNDSHGVIVREFGDNTIFGSLMCEGASGGPIIVNFGMRPELTLRNGFPYPSGQHSLPNVVIGVTSWKSTDDPSKFMGASAITREILLKLIREVCAGDDKACL